MKIRSIFQIVLSILFSFEALAHDNANLNAGDTAFIIFCTALVMLMTPGLALIYSGSVKGKNSISTMMHGFIKLSTVTLTWIAIGYSIAFSDNSMAGYFGDLKYLFLDNVNGFYSNNFHVPHIVVVMFSGMFAVVTSAIITGSFAERVRILPVIIFSILWTILVYAPVAHWIWGHGWINQILNPLDFAGGTVVHINSAAAGMVAALFIGRRHIANYENKPNNLPLTILGCGLLWFGWLGFNAGSAYSANFIAGLALVNTNVAAAMGIFTWVITSLINGKRISAFDLVYGSVAGLVAITPASGYVEVKYAFIIGGISALICYFSVHYLKPKLGYDDTLDVFGLHGVGGIWGAIATGIFCTKAANPDGLDGLITGNLAPVIDQILAIFVVIAFSSIMTYLIFCVIKLLIPIRATVMEEKMGLDEF